MARSFKQKGNGDRMKGPKYVKKTKEKFKTVNKKFYEPEDDDEEFPQYR